jgi:hypothetical protein
MYKFYLFYKDAAFVPQVFKSLEDKRMIVHHAGERTENATSANAELFKLNAQFVNKSPKEKSVTEEYVETSTISILETAPKYVLSKIALRNELKYLTKHFL